jgi:hypothetical protein
MAQSYQVAEESIFSMLNNELMCIIQPFVIINGKTRRRTPQIFNMNSVPSWATENKKTR